MMMQRFILERCALSDLALFNYEECFEECFLTADSPPTAEGEASIDQSRELSFLFLNGYTPIHDDYSDHFS